MGFRNLYRDKWKRKKYLFEREFVQAFLNSRSPGNY